MAPAASSSSASPVPPCARPGSRAGRARRRAGRRDRPALVLPGLGASDLSTLPLRNHLRLLGHPTHGWGLGTNEGPTEAIRTGIGRRFEELVERYDRPLALVGWSLGGVYAWGLAERYPDLVDAVVTLGSPLNSTGVEPPPDHVSTTSIWTRWDSVVPWRNSVIDDGPRRENIEVRSTHLTLGIDPLVLYAVGDRLGRPPERWAPFRPSPLLACAYPR